MKPLDKNKIIKGISAAFIIGGLFVGLWWYYMASTVSQLNGFRTFDAARDSNFLKKQFDADQYWLSEYTDTNADLMLKNIVLPAKQNKYGHDVYTTVLFDNNKQAGFVSYLKLRFNQGQVLFLSVDPASRGKNFGGDLLKHAIEQLKSMGCTRIILFVRESNTWARKHYTAAGFTESSRDGGFITYALNIRR